jgi:D-serine deaminase-like pyridoxal phosphate-dependent protein
VFPRAAAAVAVTGCALVVLGACSSVTDGSGRHLPASSGSAPSGTATSGTPTAARPSAQTSSGGARTATPKPTKPVRVVTVANTNSGAAYVVTIWVQQQDATCADHAYGGPVVAYLTAHPCTGLTRILATTAVGGRQVGFAQASLGFAGQADAVYKTASDFVTLVRKDGTGNINDLLREGKRLPVGPTAVPAPDAFSALGQDAGVVIDEAWYLDGPTPDNDPPLVTMAQDLFLQLG